MTISSHSDPAIATDDERVLRAAAAAYLGRYRGESRVHTGSGLEVFLTGCSGQNLDALELGRPEVERYVPAGPSPDISRASHGHGPSRCARICR
jgi:hypothetical protein